MNRANLRHQNQLKMSDFSIIVVSNRHRQRVDINKKS
jgi:hypothetical protein